MKYKIPFCKAHTGREEIKAVKRVLKSGWLTSGPETSKFEEEFADYVGSKYAVATSSCTSALELSLRWFGISDKDFVIAPSFTFCATAQAAKNNGAKILFGDIELINLTLDPNSKIKEFIKDAKAIIPVHLAGNKAFTNYEVNVVEDSAHRIERNQCCNNKNLVCFSFYPTKNMTTGEGGMIATNSKEAYEWLKMARNHGINKSDEKRYREGSFGYEVEFTGLKANMSDIAAAIGREQLKKLDYMNHKRDEAVNLYNSFLGNNWSGNHLYPIFLKERDKFISYMRENGVQCSAHFSPLHKMKGFEEYNRLSLPLTELLGETEISLPLYPDLTKKEIIHICDLTNKYKERYV